MATIAPLSSVALTPVAPPRSGRAWLLGPGWDLVFLANLAWPLLAGLAIWAGSRATWGESTVVQALTIWQVYFISTPHRWITLGLVFLDEERFRQRPRFFVGLALFFILLVMGLVLGFQVTTGEGAAATVILAAIDYFWNAWHFAAQHSGISRIYARSSRPDDQSSGLLDKILLRTFVLFVILRVGALACAPNCVTPGADERPALFQHTSQLLPGVETATLLDLIGAFVNHSEFWLDYLMLALPVFLLIRELCRFRRPGVGGVVYLLSVIAIYASLLFATRSRQVTLILGVALAVALFHATEYLTIVSWAVIRKHGRGGQGVFGYLVPRWGAAMACFIVFLAATGWMMASKLQNAWVVLTITVSFLHYAYDGAIWKARRPAPAS